MTLKEAQDKAKSLGLPFSHKSLAELEKIISEHEVEETQEEESEEPTIEEEHEEYNIAIVVNRDKNEIRRFERGIHGEDFIKLAGDFAQKNNYLVEYK